VFDYHSTIQKVPKRYENTCEWLLENSTFKSWYTGHETNALWIYGYPGRGKSVIAKFIAQTLGDEETSVKGQKLPDFLQRSTGPPSAVAHFFCSRDIDDAMSIRTALCSLTHQLLFQHPELSKQIETTWKVISQKDTESTWTLWRILERITSAKTFQFVFIVDAVDELREQFWEEFFDEFRRHILVEKSHVRIVVTSRKELVIERKVMEWNPLQIPLDDSTQATDDLNTFVRGTVEAYARENQFGEGHTKVIKEEIISRSAGMFLWATLAWHHFTDGIGLWTDRLLTQKIEQLRRLPPGLDALYHRILRTIDKRLHAEVLDVLKWIVFAKRPLSIEELSIALAMKDKPTNSREIDARRSVREFLKKRLPYIIKVNQDQVRIVHQSLRNFLVLCQEVSIDDRTIRNEFFLNGRTEERKLAADCLTYIALDDFVTMAQPTSEVPRTYGLKQLVITPAFKNKFIFLSYSTQHWPAHAEASSDDGIDAIWELFERVIDSRTHYEIMCAGYGNQGYYSPSIFVAFRLGLDYLCRKMVSIGYDINEIDEGKMHIIHSHPRANRQLDNDYSLFTSRLLPDGDIDVLLGLGADINGRDCHDQTIFIRLVATIDRHRSLDRVKSWLRRPDVNANAQDWHGRTALHVAVNVPEEYSDDLLDILLGEESLDVNALDSFGMSALTLTTQWGNQKTLQKFLQCPRVDISRASYQGESLLINVARQGWDGLLISLLERLPSVEPFCDPDNRTILHWTLIMSMTNAFRIAMTKQSQIVNSTDHRGMTALHYSVQEGNFEATMLLLDKGANPGLKTKLNESVLHLAALWGHERILKHLLKLLPAYVLNERDFMGYTTLHKAVVSGNDGLVRYLASLPFADWTKRDRHGKTPLMFAVAFGSVTNFQTVLSKSKVQTDDFGNTLLHHAVGAANDATIGYLLENKNIWISQGMDYQSEGLNSLNVWGNTALDRLAPDSPLLNKLQSAGLKPSEAWLMQQQQEMGHNETETQLSDPFQLIEWRRARVYPMAVLETYPPPTLFPGTIASNAVAIVGEEDNADHTRESDSDAEI
jgi:ankyrin repeat protein